MLPHGIRGDPADHLNVNIKLQLRNDFAGENVLKNDVFRDY